MKLYVEASSKKSLIQRLASGEEISGYNYSMFGGGGRYMLDDNLADGTIIAIYSQMSQGNPVAKSWGTWTIITKMGQFNYAINIFNNNLGDIVQNHLKQQMVGK